MSFCGPGRKNVAYSKMQRTRENQDNSKTMPALIVNRTVQVSAIYGFFFYIYMQNICCGGRGKYFYSVYSGYCEGMQ